MNVQNLLTADFVGRLHRHPTVESAGPEDAAALLLLAILCSPALCQIDFARANRYVAAAVRCLQAAPELQLEYRQTHARPKSNLPLSFFL